MEYHVEGAVVSRIEYAAYAVLGKKTVEGVGAVERRELVVEAGGGALLLNGSKNDFQVLEIGVAHGKEKTLALGGASTERKRF